MRKLFAAKLVMGGILALLFLGTLFGLLYMGLLQASSATEPVSVPVRVVGPDGSALWFGVVDVPDATAYSALRAAAREGNFTVQAEDDGASLRVAAIDGHAAAGSARWVYGVAEGDGDACYPDAPPDRFALREGQSLLWRLHEGTLGTGACA